MRIAILHLSDFHLRCDQFNPAKQWAASIAAAVAPECVECDAVYLIVTGDIAYSGKAEEYEEAGPFFEDLRVSMAGRAVPFRDVIVVPGNHDCDFELEDKVRKALLRDAVAQPDEGVVAACVAIQAAFNRFAEHRELVHPGSGSVVEAHTSQVGDVSIDFFACNSAWMSSQREKPGSIRFSSDLVPATPRRGVVSASRTLVVWVMHHPYSWFDPADARVLRKYVESTADVVLTGHEHDGGAYSRADRSGMQVDYVEGGVLQESAASDFSTFNLVVVDLEENRQRIVHFRRVDEIYLSNETEAWQDFVRNRARLASAFDHSEKFSSFLEDPGAAFAHPRQPRLRLRDIFVYPEVRDLPVAGAKERNLIRDLPDYVASRKKVIFLGAEKSGKSGIARRLCADLHAKGVVPLFAEGENFCPANATKFRAAIRKLIQAQYAPTSTEDIFQLPPSRRALLIDNYHAVRLSREGRAKLLALAASMFETVVLFSSGDARLEYLSQASAVVAKHPIFDFAHAEILQMGHVRRHELISRWHWTGRDRSDTEESEVQREILLAENLISGLIGKNLIPSYPIFVLILLQQMEVGRPHDTGAGSHGYLYQSLIINSLARIAQYPHDIDSRFNYLTELAWNLSHQRTPGWITAAELADWHRLYCERHLVVLEHPRYVEDLVGVGLLCREGARFGFSYPYVRFFFVARYIKVHLHEPDIRSLVVQYAEELHNEQTAMVMVFLAHLSSDPFVLDTMMTAARRLFEDHPEWDTDAQTEYLNTLVEHTPKLALLERSLEENRVEELARIDDGRDDDSSDDEAQTERDFAAEMEPVLKLNSAFKTIQIVGQILRTYSGSLDGQRKVELAEVCYRLGLRLLGFVFGSFGEHGEEFVRGIVGHVARARPEAAIERITIEANAFMFALFERVSFGVIRHVSQSLGHDELAPVFRELERIGDNRTPFRMIDLSIKLDHFKQPPADEAIALYEEEKENLLVATVIRHLVWYHLYLFPTEYRIRQKLCAKLSIEDQSKFIANPQKLIG